MKHRPHDLPHNLHAATPSTIAFSPARAAASPSTAVVPADNPLLAVIRHTGTHCHSLPAVAAACYTHNWGSSLPGSPLSAVADSRLEVIRDTNCCSVAGIGCCSASLAARGRTVVVVVDVWCARARRRRGLRRLLEDRRRGPLFGYWCCCKGRFVLWLYFDEIEWLMGIFV